MNEITFTPEDLDRRRIESAYASNSYYPEKRAEAHIQGYIGHMTSLSEVLLGFAQTDEQRAEIAEDLENYRQGYLNRFWSWIGAISRTANWAVTGPANFPVERNEKRMRAERKRYEEFAEWCDKHTARLKRKWDPSPKIRSAIRSDDPDAIEALEAEIQTLEATQGMMKAANRIVRSKKERVAKIAGLVALGIAEIKANSLLEPAFDGIGFQHFELTNNNAKIRRLKGRLEQLKREAIMENTVIERDGLRIVDNLEAKRLQLFFGGKPDGDTRANLKAHGFRWAPSIGAWQAYRNERARLFVAGLVGENPFKAA